MPLSLVSENSLGYTLVLVIRYWLNSTVNSNNIVDINNHTAIIPIIPNLCDFFSLSQFHHVNMFANLLQVWNNEFGRKMSFFRRKQIVYKSPKPSISRDISLSFFSWLLMLNVNLFSEIIFALWKIFHLINLSLRFISYFSQYFQTLYAFLLHVVYKI